MPRRNIAFYVGIDNTSLRGVHCLSGTEWNSGHYGAFIVSFPPDAAWV
jgi:hypothetical protein